MLGVIPEYCYLSWSVADVSEGINNLVICAEMSLAAVLLAYAFPHTDFDPASELAMVLDKTKFRSLAEGFRDIIPNDLVRDARQSVFGEIATHCLACCTGHAGYSELDGAADEDDDGSRVERRKWLEQWQRRQGSDAVSQVGHGGSAPHVATEAGREEGKGKENRRELAGKEQGKMGGQRDLAPAEKQASEVAVAVQGGEVQRGATGGGAPSDSSPRRGDDDCASQTKSPLTPRKYNLV
jgi:hypothetical protein